MYAKDQSAPILNAAREALGGEPQAGELSVTTVESGPISGYFATDFSVNSSIGEYHVYAAGIDPAQTPDPQFDPNDYYVLDVQDLSLVLSILQLSGLYRAEPFFQAALAAFKAISDQLEDRVEQQGRGRGAKASVKQGPETATTRHA